MVNSIVAAALAAASPTAASAETPARSPHHPRERRQCLWSATPTPPSTSSAPFTRSTASRNGSATRSETPSSSPTSWCLKRSFPNGRPADRAATPPASGRRRSRASAVVPRHDPHGDQSRPDRRACRSTMAPTWSCATRPKRKASRSQGLETLEFQIDMFNRMPGAMPTLPPLRGRPASSQQPMQSLSKAMVDMQAAWKQRRPARLRRPARAAQSRVARHLSNDCSPIGTPAGQTGSAARMQTPGTVFVAVGAGHLAGQDSLLVRLAERGIASRSRSLSAPNLLFCAASLRRALTRPWSSLEAWRGVI